MVTKTPLQGLDRTALEAVIEPLCVAHGAELYELEWKNEGGFVLRVFVEKAGSAANHLDTREAAASLELCAGVARDLSPALDAADLIPHAYVLEVSSPGVERPLRGVDDFVRFAGEKTKIKLTEALDGQKVFVGTIGEVDASAGTIGLVVGARVVSISAAWVASARLVFEFGASTKPGKPKGAKTKTKRPRETNQTHAAHEAKSTKPGG